jgi:hypothetical protein
MLATHAFYEWDTNYTITDIPFLDGGSLGLACVLGLNLRRFYDYG